ncbi:MAG: carboxypeptidase-like regulatory domain-containing protein [Planctomycetaceae bacterium]|jgi:hypothetical protein|nr:carboxypeptidase-like regulatory domain-containing protein [Planctomycetaceae bacterium]
MKKNCLLVLVLCLFVVGLSGCKREGMKGLVSCAGTVTKGGQPVAGVNMTFVPVSAEGEIRGANAFTDDNGAFTLKTLTWNGILPGEYKVKLTKRVPDKVYTKAEEEAARAQGKDLPVTYVEQMGKYADPNKSQLIVTIPKSGAKNLEIKIE